MTRPDFMAIAAEIVSLVQQVGAEQAAPIIALKLELSYEAGRGAGMDESHAILFGALAKLGRKPS